MKTIKYIIILFGFSFISSCMKESIKENETIESNPMELNFKTQSDSFYASYGSCQSDSTAVIFLWNLIIGNDTIVVVNREEKNIDTTVAHKLFLGQNMNLWDGDSFTFNIPVSGKYWYIPLDDPAKMTILDPGGYEFVCLCGGLLTGCTPIRNGNTAKCKDLYCSDCCSGEIHYTSIVHRPISNVSGVIIKAQTVSYNGVDFN